MIGDAEARRWARYLGVALDQIRRDHLISHVLFALGALPLDLVFIGGTALCRTHLDGARVSEDIDIVVDRPATCVETFTQWLPSRLHRDYSDLAVTGPIKASRGIRFRLHSQDIPLVEVQVIGGQREDADVPVEMYPVSLRYDELPPNVALPVPSRHGFVSMKYLAYRDRRAPRDLFDLAHLAIAGAFDAAAVHLITSMSGAPPDPAELRSLPTVIRTTWYDQLAHQTGELMDPEVALGIVHDAVTSATEYSSHREAESSDGQGAG